MSWPMESAIQPSCILMATVACVAADFAAETVGQAGSRPLI